MLSLSNKVIVLIRVQVVGSLDLIGPFFRSIKVKGSSLKINILLFLKAISLFELFEMASDLY